MDKLSDIKNFLANKTNSYGFYLKDLRDGNEVQINEKVQFPICSCFKLAVLMTVFDQVDNEQDLHIKKDISPDEFSPGGGIINFFSSSVSFSTLQLCQMMMAFSDGTSTDYLIKMVGIEKVNNKIKSICNESNVSQNIAEMVISFKKNFDYSRLKNFEEEPCYDFPDFTNAIDLANLAEVSSLYSPVKVSMSSYLSCLNVNKLWPRTSIYFPESINVIGKGGSLGFAYYANDCGVIFENDKPIAKFGITGKGFQDDKEIIELTFGILGLKILDYLGVNSAPNNKLSMKSKVLIEKI